MYRYGIQLHASTCDLGNEHGFVVCMTCTLYLEGQSLLFAYKVVVSEHRKGIVFLSLRGKSALIDDLFLTCTEYHVMSLPEFFKMYNPFSAPSSS